ncbi:MAG: MBL fold metallo-hydrolase [Lachnospiraceae bacterium]|nr:MBL fold metallo-hydrolase [Lachnospiraceae bacterium]
MAYGESIAYTCACVFLVTFPLLKTRVGRTTISPESCNSFCENADALGISLTDLDAYVLSHGHYDHSGGFEELFRRAPTAKVYARKEAMNNYLSAAGGMHEISVPQAVASQRDKFILVDGIREILPGVFLVPHNTKGLEQIGAKNGLYKKQNDQIIPDDFAHEQSLVISSAMS